MRKLQMVDLGTQYQKIKKDIDESIQSVIDSSAFINGPEVKNFQSELETYLNVKHVIPCGNGTDALQIALMALNLKPGDEVITADFTFAATVEVIHLLGLKSVLVDVDYDTFLIDPEKIRAAISPKTKAIIPVHLFGQTANMDEIMEIAKEHNLYVIEDTAQAIGADYKNQKAGTIGTIGATSFFPSKNLGCYGDGGALFTNDDELANKMRGIANHGMYKRYYHDEIGVNSRLDSMQAAILRVKLGHLDEYSSARSKAADFYNKAFEEIEDLKKDNSILKSHKDDLRDELSLVYKGTKEFLKENTENVTAFKSAFKALIDKITIKLDHTELNNSFKKEYEKENIIKKSRGMSR